MATQTQQPQTKIVDTYKIGGSGAKGVKNAKELEEKSKVRLGSPINSMEIGQERKVTLTGEIQAREFNGITGLYYTTKEGISIKVNASFDSSIHKEGATVTIVCRLFEQDGRQIKFASIKDAA